MCAHFLSEFVYFHIAVIGISHIEDSSVIWILFSETLIIYDHGNIQPWSPAFCQFSKRISTCLALSLRLIDANDVEYNKQYLQYIHIEKHENISEENIVSILFLIVLLKKPENHFCYNAILFIFVIIFDTKS